MTLVTLRQSLSIGMNSSYWRPFLNAEEKVHKDFNKDASSMGEVIHPSPAKNKNMLEHTVADGKQHTVEMVISSDGKTQV